MFFNVLTAAIIERISLSTSSKKKNKALKFCANMPPTRGILGGMI